MQQISLLSPFPAPGEEIRLGCQQMCVYMPLLQPIYICSEEWAGHGSLYFSSSVLQNFFLARDFVDVTMTIMLMSHETVSISQCFCKSMCVLLQTVKSSHIF